MFFAKIPSHTRQNAITEGDLECILTRNCEGTEQLQKMKTIMKAFVRMAGAFFVPGVIRVFLYLFYGI